MITSVKLFEVFLEVAERGVAPSPPHETYCVQFHSCREERHCSAYPEGPRTNIRGSESNIQHHHLYDSPDSIHNLCDPYLNPFIFVLHFEECIFVSGSITSKIHDTATQYRHQTYLSVSCYSMANGISFDAIFLCGEQEDEKICLVACCCFCCIRIERLMVDEERDVS